MLLRLIARDVGGPASKKEVGEENEAMEKREAEKLVQEKQLHKGDCRGLCCSVW